MAFSSHIGSQATPQQGQQGQHSGEGIEAVSYNPGHGQYPEHYNPPPPAPPYSTDKGYGAPHAAAGTREPMVMGMKRKVFWVVLAIVLVLVALVIGLGAGLGVKANQRSTPVASSSNSTATPTASAEPTTTFSPAPSSTAAATIPCPAQNNTLYTANAASLVQFRLYCDVDFSGDEGADLASVDTVSMEACMDVCASTDKCQGAGWGSTGSVSAAYTCYLKTNLTTGHDASDSAWSFAVNLNTTHGVSFNSTTS